MPVRHHPDFPEEAAQLLESCAKCADGLDIRNVMLGAMEFLSMSIVIHGHIAGLTQKQALDNVTALAKACKQSVKDNWDKDFSPPPGHPSIKIMGH